MQNKFAGAEKVCMALELVLKDAPCWAQGSVELRTGAAWGTWRRLIS